MIVDPPFRASHETRRHKNGSNSRHEWLKVILIGIAIANGIELDCDPDFDY
jgi:hypothetical protein